MSVGMYLPRKTYFTWEIPMEGWLTATTGKPVRLRSSNGFPNTPAAIFHQPTATNLQTAQDPLPYPMAFTPLPPNTATKVWMYTTSLQRMVEILCSGPLRTTKTSNGLYNATTDTIPFAVYSATSVWM